VRVTTVATLTLTVMMAFNREVHIYYGIG